MSKHQPLAGVLIEENINISFHEVCQRYHISAELLNDLIEYGFFPDYSDKPEQLVVTQKSLRRMESAFRLHRDLEINLPGVILALDLLEELEKIRSELAIFRKHF